MTPHFLKQDLSTESVMNRFYLDVNTRPISEMKKKKKKKSVDALACWLPNKHNNRPRCLRVVNSGIHVPHPLNLQGVMLKAPKPSILLILEHLKRLGPCRQRPLSSLE